MANTRMSKADRFYANPVMRDQEWNQAKQLPWWLTVLALILIAVGSFFGVYSGEPQSTIGWIVAVLTVVVYIALSARQREVARRRLREAHGQPSGG